MSSTDKKQTHEEQHGLTGTTTGSSGDHLSQTGASRLGTSGASGDMGNEKSLHGTHSEKEHSNEPAATSPPGTSANRTGPSAAATGLSGTQ
ncbi:unnamed protein product [Didymodactylos carnosus]|uniref:Uncharacterized protein n=1 Tax=Didymodactylos carnosus TaxID=1234261 RepID=A0A814I9I4_9BILA|nr:unnamed protein product [Didymodactylos carnosus]CAF1316273.1 unnamed protein product [Didymodactylos carnosus]CAF3791661.1 unnamed protein product [Didymodactylos carnosus]CAF4125266.1 unnamed protein product [Didymodactylos carnosus]